METITTDSLRLPAVTRNAHRKPELPGLTSVRFFAAMYVVFYHFAFPNLHTSIVPLRNALAAGYSAVGFFFVLSGFVLTYSYVPSDGRLSIDRLSFWKARLRRIYPAYLFAFVLAAPFQIVGSIHTNGFRLGIEKLTLGAVLVLTLTQAWTPWTCWYWNVPAWSLSTEMFFYLCFPFAVLVVGRLRPRTCLTVAIGIWLFGLLGPAVYCAIRPVPAQPPFSMMQLAIETNPITRLPDFVIGMLIGRIFTLTRGLTSRAACLSSVAALMIAGSLLSLSSAIPRLLLSNGILTPAAGLLIFTLAHRAGPLAQTLGHPVLQALGEASYAIYILQFPVSYLLRFNDRNFSAPLFAIFLVVLICLSLITAFWIERPLRRRMRSTRLIEQPRGVVARVDAPSVHGRGVEAHPA